MLSYLYRLAASFERTHNCRPNLLYLSPLHYRMLQENLAGMASEEEVERFIGMDIIISPEVRHPNVAWVSRGQGRRVAAGRG